MGRHTNPCTYLLWADILKFVLEYSRKNQYPPTLREIARNVGRGSTDTFFHIRKLEARGYLTFKQNSSRTYVVTDEGKVFAQSN